MAEKLVAIGRVGAEGDEPFHLLRFLAKDLGADYINEEAIIARRSQGKNRPSPIDKAAAAEEILYRMGCALAEGQSVVVEARAMNRKSFRQSFWDTVDFGDADDFLLHFHTPLHSKARSTRLGHTHVINAVLYNEGSTEAGERSAQARDDLTRLKLPEFDPHVQVEGLICLSGVAAIDASVRTIRRRIEAAYEMPTQIAA